MENNTDVIRFPSEQALHVLYQSSNTYVIPTGVSIYSLLKNNTDIDEIHIHVINDGIAEENVLKLERIAARFGRKIEWIDGKALSDFMERCNLPKFYGAYTTYLKIFAPNIILKAYPTAKNLLYIDSDTVVVGSLKDIPDMDLRDNVMSGVYEINTPNERKRLGITNANTINCGIILFELHNWQRYRCEETIKEKISDIDFAKKIVFAEQDIINMLYSTSIQKLPIQYNVTSAQFFLRPASKFVRRFHVPAGYYSDKEVEIAIEKPIIMHYVNCWTGRPWDEPNANPISEVYYRYKNEILPEEKVTGVKRNTNVIRNIARVSMIWIMNNVNPRIVGDLISFLYIIISKLPKREAPINFVKNL